MAKLSKLLLLSGIAVSQPDGWETLPGQDCPKREYIRMTNNVETIEDCIAFCDGTYGSDALTFLQGLDKKACFCKSGGCTDAKAFPDEPWAKDGISARKADSECQTLSSTPRPGADYEGTVSKTVSGKSCQMWNEQTPHTHDQPAVAHNYCRNPDGEPNGVWCYTSDPNTRWEYCSQIKDCAGFDKPYRALQEEIRKQKGIIDNMESRHKAMVASRSRAEKNCKETLEKSNKYWQKQLDEQFQQLTETAEEQQAILQANFEELNNLYHQKTADCYQIDA